MSARLTFEPNKKSELVAEVIGGVDDGLEIFLNEGDFKRNPNHFAKQELKKYESPDKGTLRVIPKNESSQHIYVFGSSGSGKSYFASQYANEYLRLFPDNAIYLVTYIEDDDESLRIPNLVRIPIRDIMEGKISPKTIPDSLIIMDDIDSMPPVDIENEASAGAEEAYKPKDIFLKVEQLRDSLLTTGRHNNISVLCTSHLGCNFKSSKVPINECNLIVVFPRGGNHNQISRILGVYCGLTKAQEREIYALPSRWVCLHKSYPPYVTYEKGIYIL